jgi:hypothetical protein
MAPLKDQMETIVREISAYAKPALNGGSSYLTRSADGALFTVVDFLRVGGTFQADSGLIVRIEKDYIIIAQDLNNKPLVDALVQAGIPRQQIILAYMGEPIPEAV